MNLIFVLLALSVLGLKGCAQRSQEKPGNATRLHQILQKGARLVPVTTKDSQRTEKTSKQEPTKSRNPNPSLQTYSQTGNTLVAGRGQCIVNGMVMYDGAAWAPRPCIMCICDQGKQVCQQDSCETISCHSGQLQTSPGSCCPTCVKTGPPKSSVFLPTPKPNQQKNIKGKKEKEENQEDTIGNGERGRQPKAKNGFSTTTHASAVSVSTQTTKKQSEISKVTEVVERRTPSRKKELHNDNQQTSNQKKGMVLGKSKKEQNGKKASGHEVPKVQRKEPPTEERRKHSGVKKESTRNSSAGKKITEDQVETNRKSDIADSLTPAPTDPVIEPPTRPTENDMPSLPSGCLLAESTIACANTKMKYLPLMTDLGLKTLYLADNEISKLPARAFSGLPNLEWLDLSKNKLGDSGLSTDVFQNLTKLKRLNLDGNRLTVLPILPQSLQELKINDNNLRELNKHSFRGLSNLLNLELEGNSFHDGNVNPLTFKPLKKLTYLRLDHNHFRAIPSGLPASLQELHLDNNRIEIISEGILNKTLNLSILVLSNNRLQENHIAPRAWIDLLNLESLDLSHNRLVHVPSFLPRGLKYLFMHHNQIERIPGYVFAHLKPGLEFLHLSRNHLRDDGIHTVSFFGLYKSLNELLLDNNLLQSIPRGILNLKNLQVLRLSFNKIRYIPLNSICDTRISEDSNLVSVHLEHNFINRRLIPPTAFSCIKTYHSVILRPQHNEYEDY
ncbi:extracellular matrix protein 2-like [Spea bombifrons]|uniref:extracellular matrix protein 2-like n=1 Tax=Spea bombifrons TaxID=233779 RepID=UPI0023494BEE|nr:extracellular matrix protein 2-like [Spea bombifrons]